MGAAPLIEVFKNGESLKSVPIDRDVNVGRGDNCVIRLEDRAVSRQHALFRNAAKGVEVLGRSEFSPLKVNGVEQTSAILKSGDVVEIGPYLLKVKLEEIASTRQAVLPAAKLKEFKPDPVVVSEAAMVHPTLEEPVTEPPVSESIENLGFESTEEPAITPEVHLAQPSRNEMSASVAIPDFSVPGSSSEATKVFTNVDVMVKLKIPEGAAQVTEMELTREETVLGRGAECDVILSNEKKASRKHAVIRKKGLNFILQDLGTPNGTLLNGRRIEESALADGDIIQVGDTKIEFKASSGDALPDSTVSTAQTQSSSPDRPDEETKFMESARSMFLDVGKANIQEVGVTTMLPPLSGGGSDEGLEVEITEEGPRGLLQKWKDPKQRKKIITIVCGAILALTFLFESEEKPQPQKAPVKAENSGPNALDKLQVTKKGLEKLTADQVAFIQARYQAAMKHYQNNDFDQSLYELNKIFEVAPEYEPARELQKYVLEGKRRMQVVGDEKKRSEDEARVKAKIEEIVGKIENLMKQKDYDVARSLFPDLLSLDPGTERIRAWERIMAEEEEKKRRAEDAKKVAASMNQRAWSAYQAAQSYRKSGQCLTAISLFADVLEMQAPDKRPFAMARKGIQGCRNWIKSKREPLLAQAKELEASGDLSGAFKLYSKVNKIDPGNVFAVAGMTRIRDVLHGRAKVLFSEGLVAETFSDFDGAFKKYEETLAIAPEDDDFYGRALRKLKRYQRQRAYAEHILSDAPARAPGSVQVPEGSYETSDPSAGAPPPAAAPKSPGDP